jgi:CubicO group peptidase (beta-lactamase class C family)
MVPGLKAPNILDQLEILVKSQSSKSGSSVLDILTELGTHIVSVAILDSGEISARVIGDPKRGDNSSNIGSLKSFDDETLFQACSISKAVAALAVIKLCQGGILDLDVPISRYLSPEQLNWISTVKTLALARNITLRLLLSHTSGLSCTGFPGYSTTEIPTIQQILTGSPPCNTIPVTPISFPGQKYWYSGGGFTVIQLILETVLQNSFPQIMDEVVLLPLKMTRSTYNVLPATEKNYAPAYRTGKVKADPDHHHQPESAAAGLWTTPSDLLRVVLAVQGSLESDDGFLERKWAEIMLTEVNDNQYALGWRALKNGITFGHNGSNDPGYRTLVNGFADLTFDAHHTQTDGDNDVGNLQKIPKDCGISVMTSSELGDIMGNKISAAISYLKGWPAVNPPALGSTFVVPFADRGKHIDKAAKAWAGFYEPGRWALMDDEFNGLQVICGRLSTTFAMPLIPAATPPRSYAEGISIDLVVDGLEIMLHLGWKDGSRIIEMRAQDVITMLEKRS